MIIGKLFCIPFSTQLFVAEDISSGEELAGKGLVYLRDVEHTHLSKKGDKVYLSSGYMVNRHVKCTKGVIDKWERLKSAQ